ncbi:MAG TPA: cadmium resistance transporter [Chloroflexota bacterium]|jgi:cadmium resistance protein CadD (predicted permease)
MESWLGVLALGLAAFVSTNVDGLLVLMIFFADAEIAPPQIVAGQLVATVLWIAISVAASAAAVTLPTRWLALLGIIPIALGSSKLKALRSASAGAMDERAEVEMAARRSLQRTRSRVSAVALVALANGGDNVAVYIALFSISTPNQIAAFVVVFLTLAIAWCMLAYYLVRRTWLGAQIEQYGERALPFILMGLGLYIGAKALRG